MWTVDREIEQPIRHMDLNRSGGSFVAHLTLRVVPDLDVTGVGFAGAVTDPEATYYVPFVQEGVREFVVARASEGKPVGHLLVTLTAITVHPADVKGWRFLQAARLALMQAFDAVGVEF